MLTKIFALIYFSAFHFIPAYSRIPEEIYFSAGESRTPAGQRTQKENDEIQKITPLKPNQLSVEQRKTKKAEKVAARKVREHKCLASKATGNYRDCPPINTK